MKFLGALMLALCFVGPAAAADAANADSGRETVIRAMKDELARSMALELPTMARPYFISYAVVDQETQVVLSEYGGLVDHNRWRLRTLEVDVRVGDRTLGSSSATMSFSIPIALDDDYDAIRRQIWLATDAAYKQAAGELEQKRAALSQSQHTPRDVPEFSIEKPAQLTTDTAMPSVDLADKVALARAMSAVLSDYPAIYEGVAELTATRKRRIVVTSEGTVTVEPSSLAKLEFKCRTQAADGMNLVNYGSWLAPSASQLPDQTTAVARARQVADELVALRAAPLIEEYTGPILFEGEAAAQVVSALLVRHLSGTPPANDPRFPAFASDDTLFASRVGKKVLPAQFSVVDDPGLTKWGDQPLIGGYKVDDEGVVGQKVSLVERGMLRRFLMSRTPRKKFMQSNGHGRTAFGGQAKGVISNLVITAGGGATARALESKLAARARSEGEPFGIVITRLDDFSVTSGYRDAGESLRPGGEGGVNLTPILAYRIKNGKRELVRGVDIDGLRVRSLKEIVGSSSTARVYNSLQNGVPSSIVTPDLLFEEADIKPRTGNNPRLPVLTSPLVK